MNSSQAGSPSAAPRRKFQRKVVNFSSSSLVETEFLPGLPIPVVVRPAIEGVDLVSWASSNQEFIQQNLQTHRAILLRGFQVPAPAYFESFVTATSSGPLLEYKDRSTPRYEVGEHVYVSTIYPSDQRINPHNEGTYWMHWPLKIYFCCLKAAATGGETPIADVRKVYARIAPEIVEEFRRKQVMYVRNYNPGVGLTWQDAFQTTTHEAVEEYAAKNRIQVEWKDDGRLLTRQIRPAVRTHPQTGEQVWFNHAAFFHVSSLDPVVREALLNSFGEEGLPYNTYYGDGARIDPQVVAHIREAYATETLMFPWLDGDILMLDNMSVAHAREPYTGERKVIVGMTEAQSDSSS
jgi:alpha-ketoglutarate-dependent taurine dioxygenase